MRLRSSHSVDLAVTIDGSAKNSERRLLGELLGLDAAQQSTILDRQTDTGQLFGETAVELGLATDEQVRRATEEQQGFSVLAREDKRIDPLVVCAFDPLDPLARAARKLRATLTAATRPDGTAVRTVALFGLGLTVEGAVVVANVAVACAQAGTSTLLVDADLEQPHQHSLFRVRNRAGLSTLISGGGGEVGQVHATAINGLGLLTSGPSVPNAPELLDRQRLADLLEGFDDFRLIVVDVGSGSTSIAASVALDACLILLRRNVSLARELKLLVDQLEANGQSVLGTVLID